MAAIKDQRAVLYLSGSIDGVDKDNQETTEWLKNILEPIGIEVEFSKGCNEYVDTLTFRYNANELKEKRTRKAGRKRSLEYQYTVEQVRSLIDEKGAVEAARELKMSKNQMYVRLKKAKELDDEYF